MLEKMPATKEINNFNVDEAVVFRKKLFYL